MQRSTRSLAILTVALPLVWAAAVDMAVYNFADYNGLQAVTPVKSQCGGFDAGSITRAPLYGLPAKSDWDTPGHMTGYGWYQQAPVVDLTTTPITNDFTALLSDGIQPKMNYFEFKLTPTTCQYLDLDAITFAEQRSFSQGPLTVSLRSSLDGYATELLDATNLTTTDNGIGVHTATLSSAFDQITQTLTFRIYAYGRGAQSDNKQWALMNYTDSDTGTAYGVRIEGTVVPEPAAWMLLAGAGSLVGLTHRPRRRHRRQP
ncbi:MAG: hypothetical protein GX657_16410 [Chloroflexi bacterium]|nr:hypothetical protein [Chloroflexota bacterium]